jgi:hypothetical protein
VSTDVELQELARALSGGWSLNRACALAIIFLREAETGRRRGGYRHRLDHQLSFNTYSSESANEGKALTLLEDAGLTTGTTVDDVTDEGWRAAERLRGLQVPALLAQASRELLLHALYQAGRSEFVLRDAYWGQRFRKKYDDVSEPWFEPWLVFAGSPVPLGQFEDALDHLVGRGLAKKVSRKAHQITEAGRDLIEGSTATSHPGYLSAQPTRSAAAESDGRNVTGAAPHATAQRAATPPQQSNHVTYVIHGDVSNLVGNAGDSTVGIVNSVDARALADAAEQLRELLPSLRMNDADASSSEAIIDDVLTQARTSTPDGGRLRGAMKTLKELIGRTRAPLTDIAVGVINEQIRRLGG